MSATRDQALDRMTDWAEPVKIVSPPTKKPPQQKSSSEQPPKPTR